MKIRESYTFNLIFSARAKANFPQKINFLFNSANLASVLKLGYFECESPLTQTSFEIICKILTLGEWLLFMSFNHGDGPRRIFVALCGSLSEA